MASVDAGIKYKGFSLEAEYYWRKLSDFTGTEHRRASTTSTTTATRCRPRPWPSRRRSRCT